MAPSQSTLKRDSRQAQNEQQCSRDMIWPPAIPFFPEEGQKKKKGGHDKEEGEQSDPESKDPTSYRLFDIKLDPENE